MTAGVASGELPEHHLGGSVGPYRTISGTSMATPHIAGVAALLVETFESTGAAELSDLILRRSRRLPLPSTDAGMGMARWVRPGTDDANLSDAGRRVRTPRTQSGSAG